MSKGLCATCNPRGCKASENGMKAVAYCDLYEEKKPPKEKKPEAHDQEGGGK